MNFYSELFYSRNLDEGWVLKTYIETSIATLWTRVVHLLDWEETNVIDLSARRALLEQAQQNAKLRDDMRGVGFWVSIFSDVHFIDPDEDTRTQVDENVIHEVVGKKPKLRDPFVIPSEDDPF